MDCVVTAGGIPQEGDILYECTQGMPKALVDIAGRPMVQRVVDALTAARCVDRIVVGGLPEDTGIQSTKLAACVPDQGSLLANALGAADHLLSLDPTPRQFLLCSGDIPLISGGMVDEFASQCADPSIEFYYGVVRRELMEAAFPESRRSYVHLTDGDMAGGDIFVLHSHVTENRRELFEELIGDRKSALRQARRIGLGVLVKLLLHRLSIAEAEQRVARSMGLNGRVVLLRHAELGMDVDKPFQLEICRRALGDGG